MENKYYAEMKLSELASSLGSWFKFHSHQEQKVETECCQGAERAAPQCYNFPTGVSGRMWTEGWHFKANHNSCGFTGYQDTPYSLLTTEGHEGYFSFPTLLHQLTRWKRWALSFFQCLHLALPHVLHMTAIETLSLCEMCMSGLYNAYNRNPIFQQK